MEPGTCEWQFPCSPTVQKPTRHNLFCARKATGMSVYDRVGRGLWMKQSPKSNNSRGEMYNLVQPILTRKLIFHCNCHLHLFWIINKKVKGQYGRIMHMQSMTDAKCQMLMYWYMFCLPIMMDRCNVGNIRATYNEFINFTFVHDKRTKHRGHLVATGLSNVHNLSLSFQMFIWNNCGAERAFFVIIKLIRSR